MNRALSALICEIMMIDKFSHRINSSFNYTALRILQFLHVFSIECIRHSSYSFSISFLHSSFVFRKTNASIFLGDCLFQSSPLKVISCNFHREIGRNKENVLGLFKIRIFRCRQSRRVLVSLSLSNVIRQTEIENRSYRIADYALVMTVIRSNICVRQCLCILISRRKYAFPFGKSATANGTGLRDTGAALGGLRTGLERF